MVDAIETFCIQKLPAKTRQERVQAAKDLKEWIENEQATPTEFTSYKMIKLCKGLFCSMGRTDDPQILEELTKIISETIHVFETTDLTLLYIKQFFRAANGDWRSLVDPLRIDKYQRLVRVFLHQCFWFLRKLKWDYDTTYQLVGVLEDTVINAKSIKKKMSSIGLRIHVANVYAVELSKVVDEQVTGKLLTVFFLPYCRLLARCRITELRQAAIDNVFEFTMKVPDYGDADRYVEAEHPSSYLLSAYEDHQLYDEEDTLERIRIHRMEGLHLPFPNFDFGEMAEMLRKLLWDSAKKLRIGYRLPASHIVSSFAEMSRGVFPDCFVTPSLRRKVRSRGYAAAANRLLNLELAKKIPFFPPPRKSVYGMPVKTVVFEYFSDSE